MIPSEHPFDDDRGHFGPVTLPNEVLMIVQFAHSYGQSADVCKIILAQPRVFLEFFDQDG
jgi:hypothetical protein